MPRHEAAPVLIQGMYYPSPRASPAKVVDGLAEHGKNCSVWFRPVRAAFNTLKFCYREFIVDPAELGIQLVSVTIAYRDLAVSGQCVVSKSRLLEGG